MMIDVRDRGTGKTTTLITDAFYTGLPILTLNITRKNNMIHQAQCMGMGCVIVYTVSEFKDLKGTERPDQILVDELEDVINYLIGATVVKCNMSRKGVIK